MHTSDGVPVLSFFLFFFGPFSRYRTSIRGRVFLRLRLRLSTGMGLEWVLRVLRVLRVEYKCRVTANARPEAMRNASDIGDGSYKRAGNNSRWFEIEPVDLKSINDWDEWVS